MSDELIARLAAQYNDEPEQHPDNKGDESGIIEGELADDPEENDEQDDPGDAEPSNDETESDGNPPGFIDNLDDWISAGKDPDLFKGKAAYKAEFARIQEVKELKSSVKSMADTLKATVDAIEERESKSEEKHRIELEEALKAAKDYGDTDAALEAAEKLRDIKDRPKPAPVPTQNPVITDFLSETPALQSDELNGEFARIYNGRLKADGVGPTDELSPAAMKGYLKSAMESVKSLYPDRFVSPKNNRASPPRVPQRPARQKVDVRSALKSYKIDGASAINNQAALDIYDSINKSNPEAAKTYAKNILGVEI